MHLLDDKTLRRCATTSSQMKKNYELLPNKDVDFDYKEHKKINANWARCDIYIEDREQPYYLDDYILPLRESHDNDKYIYNTCPVTK